MSDDEWTAAIATIRAVTGERALTRDELRLFNDRSPPRVGSWRDFEPQSCVIVECVGGYRAVVLEQGPMDLAVKARLVDGPVVAKVGPESNE